MADNGLLPSLEEWQAQTGGSASDYLSTFSNTTAAPPKAPEQGDVSRGFSVAMKQLPQVTGGAIYALGDALGFDSWKDYGKDLYLRKSAEVEALSKDTDSFSRNWEQGTLGDWVDFVQYGIGYTGGQALQALATGGIGSVAGKAAIGTGLKGFLSNKIEQTAGQMMAAEAAKGVALDEAKKAAIRKAAEIGVARETAGWVGATSALQGFNFTQELGSIYPDMADEVAKQGRPIDAGDRLRAFGSAAVAAAIETAADVLNLRTVAGKRGGVMTDALRGGPDAGVARRAAADVPAAMLREGGTEAAQTAVEHYGAQQPIADEAGWKDIIDSAALGALGGVGPGGISSLHRNAAAETITNKAIERIADPGTSSTVNDVLRTAVQADAAIDSLPDPISGFERRGDKIVPKLAFDELGRAGARTASDLAMQSPDAVEAGLFNTPMDAERAAPIIGRAQTESDQLNRYDTGIPDETAPQGESVAPTGQTINGLPIVEQRAATPAAAAVPAEGTTVPKAYVPTITPTGDFAVRRTNLAEDRAHLAADLAANRQRIEALQASGKSTGNVSEAFDAELAPHEMVKGASALVGTGSPTGAVVRFFKPKTKTTVKGWRSGRYIWINADLDSHTQRAEVFGHELDHYLEAFHPELYKEYGAVRDQYITGEHLASVAGSHGELGAARQEAGANLSGAALTKPEFWSELKAKSPNLFAKLADAVTKFFDYLIGKLSASTQPMAKLAHADAVAIAKQYANLISRAGAVHQGNLKQEAAAQQRAQQKAQADQQAATEHEARRQGAEARVPPELEPELLRQEPAEPKPGRIVGAKEAQQTRKEIEGFAKRMGLPEGAQSATLDGGGPMMSTEEPASTDRGQEFDDVHRDEAGRFATPDNARLPVQGEGEFTKREQGEVSSGKFRSETSLNRADRGSFTAAGVADLPHEKNWAVLTAEDPNNTKATPAYNKAAMDELRAWLKREGVDFIDVVGKYGTIQNSVIVYGRKVDAAFAERARARFEQESVLVPEGLLYADGKLNPATGESRIIKDDDYYTELPDGARWNYGIDFDRTTKLGGPQMSVAPESRSSVAIRTKREPLVIEGKPTTRPIAQALEKRTRKIGAIGEYDTGDRARDKIAEAIVEEVVYELQNDEHASGKSGVGWYSTNYPRSIDRLAAVFPELADSRPHRDLFTAILAIFSNGQTVSVNARMAVDAYAQITRDGVSIRDIKVAANRETRHALEALDDALRTLGAGAAHEYLLEEISVKEMNRILRENGQKVPGTYPVDMMVPRAAVVLGPKIGVFYANLMGRHGYLTMDRWWNRTFNRLRGNLIPWPTEQGLNNLRELLSKEQGDDYRQVSDEDVIIASIPYWHDYAERGYKNGTELEKKANTVIKAAAIELNDAPKRASDRRFMVATARRAQQLLAQKGYDLTVADIQAAAWYYEKRLYSELGARDSGAVGYEEAITAISEKRGEDRRSVRSVDRIAGSTAGQDGAEPVRGAAQAGGRGQFSIAAGPAAPAVRSGAGGRPDAAEVVGIHYGKQNTPALSGRFFGSGIKGAEQERLREATDPRIRRRVYFYVGKEGAGLPPAEHGLGPWVYRANLGNLWEAGKSQKLTFAKPEVSPGVMDWDAYNNNFESAVLDAGYDGYVNRNAGRFGIAVVLNKDVPVELLGNRAQAKIEFSVAPPVNSEAFKRWFGDSRVVDAEGRPLVVYHGTFNDFASFATDEKGTTEGAAFFTPDPAIASNFADPDQFGVDIEDGAQPNVRPVYLSLKNPMVVSAPEVMVDNGPSAQVRYSHSFDAMWAVVRKARRLGHDGLVIRDVPDGGGVSDQYAAFRPEQIKSAIGNNGNFDPADRRINYSIDNIDYSSFLLPEEDDRTLSEKIAADLKSLRETRPLSDAQIAELGRKWIDYARNPDRFSYPISFDSDLENVAYDMSDRKVRVSAVAPASTKDKEHYAGTGFVPTKVYKLTVSGAPAFVYEDKKGRITLDVAHLKQGEHGGSLAYQIVGTWAANSGKVFIGDPAGLSNRALFRRAVNMLSTALRTGTTTSIAPHGYQTQAGLEWHRGDDDFNVGSLALWVHDTMALYAPHQFQGSEFDAARPYRGFGGAQPSAGVDPRTAHGGARTVGQVALTDQFLRELAGVEGGADAGAAAGVRPALRPDGAVRQGLVERPLYSVAEPFYSELGRQVEKSATNAAPAAGWESLIKGLVNKGIVKQDEVEWSGITDWLKTQGKKVSKADVTAFLNGNGVHVTETLLGGNNDLAAQLSRTAHDLQNHLVQNEEFSPRGAGQYVSDAMFGTLTPSQLQNQSERTRELADELQRLYELRESGEQAQPEDGTKFHSYALPGGQNYRELLLTLPEREPPFEEWVSREYGSTNHWGNEEYADAHRRWRDTFGLQTDGTRFRSGHWDQPNILAHVRFNERADADGKKVLFIEEIQSDWAQKGKREGFATGRIPSNDELVRTGQWLPQKGSIPSAPFVTKTDAWVALALKRMIHWAANNGFDRVAWTTGEQQVERYDLSKQVDDVLYTKNEDGTYNIGATIGMNKRHIASSVPAGELDHYVGKDLAKKIANGDGIPHTATDTYGRQREERALSGPDLKIGGEGMKTFYDQIVPKVANDVLRKLGGGKVSETRIYGTGDGSVKSTQPSFDITPALRERAAGGLPLFSIESTSGNTNRYDEAQKAAFRNVGRTVQVPTLRDRIAGLRKDLGKKMAQGLADQFAPLKEFSAKAYALARLSKGASGAFEALLKHGKLFLRDGVYDADQSGGFIERVGVPLHGEVEDFLWWIAANRAERLTKEEREHLFKADDIEALKRLSAGTTEFDYTLQYGPKAGQITRNREEIYKDALQAFNEFNQNALDMAEQSGLIDKESRAFWEHEFYVPFYRESEKDGGFIGARIKSGVVRQEAFKTLKGGQEKLHRDLLNNTLQNWAHLIDAGAKNRAAQAAITDAADIAGVAVEMSESEARSLGRALGARKDIVWFMDEGRQRYFVVGDPYVMTAISALEYAGMRGPLMDALTKFKRYLTIGVTASPAFKVRNLIRDSIQAIATSDLSYNPVTNVVEGFKASKRGTQDYVSALASGAIIRFGTMLEGSEADRTRQLIKQGVKDETILDSEPKWRQMYDRYIEPAISAYNELGNRSEEINRLALYKQLRSQGMDNATAALLARDLMDFSLQGSWAGIRFLAQIVPFFNARLQGMYKLGRAMNEDPRKFATVVGATALFSIALMAAYSGDPDWDKREEWDRDNYWWFKIGGTAFRIPKPFEVGAMASLAERGVEYFADPKMTGQRLAKSVVGIIGNNLSMNPIPQGVKPILDIYANKDSFTGRPIETMGMDRLRPDYRYTSNTSMGARALSSTVQGALDATGLANAGINFLSPVQIDHLVRGYFGWLGTFINGAADAVARPLTSEPSRPAPDYFKLATQGFVSTLPEPQSRYVTQMYEQAQAVEQAYGTWRQLLKEGRSADAAEYARDNREELARYRRIEPLKKQASTINQQIRIIENSNLDPGVKRERIQALRERASRMAETL